MSTKLSSVVVGLVGSIITVGAVAYLWKKKRRNGPSKRVLKSFQGADLLSVDKLSKEQIQAVLDVAAKVEVAIKKHGTVDWLKHKILGLVFLEPSTRTRCSFETAHKRLGGQAIVVDNISNSSTSKGETLGDTIRTLSSYTDAIVLRHPKVGAAQEAGSQSSVPIINAGDGAGEHPTQALLDLFTISTLFPCILDNTRQLRVAFVGDLKFGRTVHSLAKLLARYNTYLIYVAPDGLQMPEEIQMTVDAVYADNNFNAAGRQRTTTSLAQVLPRVDVLYMTRIQRERFTVVADYEEVKDSYCVTSAMLDQEAAPHCKVFHPLPRIGEISSCVDQNPRAAYFQQVEKGLYTRAALLLLLFGKAHEAF
eukprot:Platyproteum_vivax@DN3015_c0_g1_i1.p1